ncbi:DUF4387 domain-containing protein [Trebonia kvetii]|uniref:DUF4387 domain-containing protein n=1 Tax=Trebonia kvetii TaxID=2480626 RepID=A0A6P2BPW0_9ACTN|nr:DUF4387 domain-containing protein [Trebonia kvetii]TVZ00990.1 DUF4387 domain-containing protein [Trebonia kvetii]
MPDASEEPRTLDDLALEVRCKNAGPFWMTLDVFLPDDAAYRIADAMITPEVVAELYQVPRESLRIFRIPQLRVVKVSFPRPVPQGGLHDRDMHAGQHHVPLASLPLPAPALTARVTAR